MKRLTMLVALLAALPGTAAERFEIRGVGIGDTRAQVEAAGFECSQGDGVFADETCFKRGFGEDTRGYVNAVLVGGAVESVHVRIESSYFGGTLLAMSTKYGVPKIEDGSVENRMGVSFRNRKATWNQAGADARIVAEERLSKVTKSGFTLESDAGVAAYTARFEASRGEVADSL